MMKINSSIWNNNWEEQLHWLIKLNNDLKAYYAT